MPPWWSSVPSELDSPRSSSRQSIVAEDERHGDQAVQQQRHQAGQGQQQQQRCWSQRNRYGSSRRHRQPALEELVREQSQSQAYDEIKRMLIFAGLFFLFMICFVLVKFQIPVDDVFRWSPVVWLAGVIVCGLLMNLCLHFRRFLHRRKENRQRERQNLLYSLHLPGSFPCLAPASCGGCHRHFRDWEGAHDGSPHALSLPPPYEHSDQCRRVSPPAFVVAVVPQHDRQRNNKAPPKYRAPEPELLLDDNRSRGTTSSEEEDIAPPCYDEQARDEVDSGGTTDGQSQQG